MQLYSVDKKVSQPLQGHAGAFATIELTGREDPAQLLVFHEKKTEDPSHKLFVMEVGRDPSKGTPHRLPPTVIPVPAEAAQDFPVSMVVDAKDDIAFLLTKMGFVYMFDIHSGKTMFRTRITQETVFVTCPQESTGAVFGITVRTGRVLRISLNGPNLVPYIINTLRDTDLAIKVAGRLGLAGAEHLYTQEFERLIGAGQVKEAATLVAASGSALRTPQTIARFQQIPAQTWCPSTRIPVLLDIVGKRKA